jgi:hypothetical protein
MLVSAATVAHSMTLVKLNTALLTTILRTYAIHISLLFALLAATLQHIRCIHYCKLSTSLLKSTILLVVYILQMMRLLLVAAV